MAEQQPSGGSSGPYPVEAGFPINGLSQVAPFANQEAGTSPDMLNVFPFDANGRMRGSSRPGLLKYSTAQVNGSASVQCLSHIASTYVAPILGDGQAVSLGRVAASTPGFSYWSAAAGTETAVSPANRNYLCSAFGANGSLYVVSFNPADNKVYFTCYTSAAPTVAAYTEVNIFTASALPVNTDVLGFTIDEDTFYLWYLKITGIGEGIMRIKLSDGSNRDSSTKGVWIRAEADATSIEKVFGGVGTAGWTVIPATSHSMMKAYQGRIAVAAAPIKDGASPAHELVLYIIDSKTGIVDAIHDLGIDGQAGVNQGVLIDLEYGIDGFVYVLFQDYDPATPANSVDYLRKVTTTGDGVWEILIGTTGTHNSISYNIKRAAIALAGNNVLGTGASLALIDADSKGILDYTSPATRATWSLVRCDKDGKYTMFDQAGQGIGRFNADFTTIWEKRGAGTGPNSTDQARASSNSFYNTGTDEQGSTRYLETIAIAGGTATKITSTTSTAISGGTGFSTTATTIFDAVFGTLSFFADGQNHYYYSAPDNAIKNWKTDVKYGALPQDDNGGFPYIEVWNSRVVAFGLVDDPTNWYMSAKGDPFDWKLSSGVIGGAISGRLSPAGLFPDRLIGVIPYNDDLCVFCGDHSMYQLTLDPAVDGRFDLISSTVGIAPGRAWCRDGYGAIFFLGNSGGFFRLSLNSPPQRISNKTIDKAFENIDLNSSVVHLVWDAQLQGIHIFVRSSTGSQQTQYFYDVRTEGWFPYQFGSASYQPSCVAFFDEDAPQDRKILLGCRDGYVRYFSTASKTDDGTVFKKHYTLGPWQPRSMGNTSLMLHEIDPVIGDGSQVTIKVMVGDSTQDVVDSGRSMFARTVFSPRTSIFHPRVRARSIALRIESDGNSGVEMEGIRMVMEDVRRL